MTSAPREPDDEDTTDDGRQIANQGPVPPEPEDMPDTGEGTLAPQMGDEDIEDERGRHA
ncbi:hypothetical protein [uncultured Aeromicrobium sp.]|uniref:hypothetical protein n=1 Tax=uncultured Aeromicrobium sp. TaxID=337820 RepID=UPI0025F3BC69|nr:hypothetical protein [uncultured Aeromicrobium sp.]